MLHIRKLASAALTAGLVTAGGIGATALTASTAHAGSCPTTSQIVTDINAIASGAGVLNSQLAALTRSSSPSEVQSRAQSTAEGLNTMSNELTADVSDFGGCPDQGSADSRTVADAFASLAGATQKMLGPLTGDHPLFAQFGVTAPIASSLRALEAALDSYAYALLAVAPSQQGAIAGGQSSVNDSLGNAIGLYGQICIPSPLYPTVQPVCVGL
jgi:Hydrophobic surface binding protein A